MLFGLFNALASFQGYINKILAEKLDIFVIIYLDDILIYTQDERQGHGEAVRWVLDLLRKNDLFANLKKCRFHQDEVCFLEYILSAQRVQIKDEKIEAMRNWPEPKSVRDIQVFLGFANFYQRFIQGFSKIAGPLTSMLRTTRSAENSPSLMAEDAEVDSIGGGGDREDETVERSPLTSKNSVGATGYLTPGAKQAFTQLRQAFTKALILRHFDPECHIRIETDASSYAIGGVLSQLTSDNSGRWYPVAFYSQKMIPAETHYETHDGELLAIVEAFKTWQHYLEGCKHKVLVLTDHNNLRRFMDTKSLSSRQVCQAQELSRYHFWIDYHQGKANWAADVLSRFSQRNKDEEEKLQAENTQIFHCLQSSLTNATLSGLFTSSSLSPLHQVLICGTHALLQLRRFWNLLQTELTNEAPYLASIDSMRLWLQELQETDSEAQELRQQGQKDYKEVDGVLHHQGLPFVPKAIWMELISHHHDNPLAGHFGIEKTRKLLTRKYFWPSLRHDVDAYIKGCDVCLALKAVRHKPYNNLQSLPIPTHW